MELVAASCTAPWQGKHGVLPCSALCTRSGRILPRRQRRPQPPAPSPGGTERGGAEEWPPLSRARSSARGPRAAAVQVRVRPSRCPHREFLVTATGCADVTPSRGCPQSPLGAAPPPASFWAVLLGGCPIPWHRPLAERCLRAPRASHPASVSPSRGRAWPVCTPRAALGQHQGHPGAKSCLGAHGIICCPPPEQEAGGASAPQHSSGEPGALDLGHGWAREASGHPSILLLAERPPRRGGGLASAPLPTASSRPRLPGSTSSKEGPRGERRRSRADPAVRKWALTSARKPSLGERERARESLFIVIPRRFHPSPCSVHALRIFPACYHASGTCSAAKAALTLSCCVRLQLPERDWGWGFGVFAPVLGRWWR